MVNEIPSLLTLASRQTCVFPKDTSSTLDFQVEGTQAAEFQVSGNKGKDVCLGMHKHTCNLNH
jgi:hypothetical protein